MSVKRQFCFCDELDVLVSGVPILGDLNWHVGSTRVGFDGVHGAFVTESRNQEEEGVLNFALVCDLIVVNTLFRASRLVTFCSCQHCTHIDFILAKREDRHVCLDCKAIPRECVMPQRKMVVADFHFRIRWSKRIKVPRMKWWKLKKS
jgi:hypothetical protein